MFFLLKKTKNNNNKQYSYLGKKRLDKKAKEQLTINYKLEIKTVKSEKFQLHNQFWQIMVFIIPP